MVNRAVEQRQYRPCLSTAHKVESISSLKSCGIFVCLINGISPLCTTPMQYRRTPVKTRERRDFGALPDAMELPDLIEVQRRSYRWFFEEGIKQLFSEISPVKDFIGRDL